MNEAKFNFKGVLITVPVESLGEAMRQLGLLGTSAQSLPDANTFAAQHPFPSPRTESLLLMPKPSDHSTVLKFLKYIEEYGTSGTAKIEGIMGLLGVDNPKGVGSKSASINRVLTSYGFKPDDVYTNPRESSGDRYWRPGPMLKAAISAIEKGVPGA